MIFLEELNLQCIIEFYLGLCYNKYKEYSHMVMHIVQ